MTAAGADPAPVRFAPRPRRGARSNPAGRFESAQTLPLPGRAPAAPDTRVTPMPARRLINYNDSPDLALRRTINPYRGCEHGCAYCFARPTHAYLGLSAGLDFETRIFAKTGAAAALARELSAPGYRCAPLGLGYNTDAWQPAERRLRITRGILETLWRFRHPVSAITKSPTCARDLDLLGKLAGEGLAEAVVSVTTLDPDLHRILEPRAGAPAARLRLVRALAEAGVPTGVLAAPVIPYVNEGELERIAAAAADAGARFAGYVVLRLPHELKQLFREWLEAHFPQRAARVMAAVRELHGGRDYDPAWGRRMSGQGERARLLAQRFRLACRRHGLDRPRPPLRTDRFRVPGAQRELFGAAP